MLKTFHFLLVFIGIERLKKYGSVAQSVEQRTENPRVGGSIPSRATIYMNFERSQPSKVGFFFMPE
jgi:hypothetical protein